MCGALNLLEVATGPMRGSIRSGTRTREAAPAEEGAGGDVGGGSDLPKDLLELIVGVALLDSADG